MKKNTDPICLSTCGELSGFTGGYAKELMIGKQKTKQKMKQLFPGKTNKRNEQQ